MSCFIKCHSMWHTFIYCMKNGNFFWHFLKKFFRQHCTKKKSCIRETLNLSKCGESSTATKTDKRGRNKVIKRNMSCVMYHVSHVMRHVSHFACHPEYVSNPFEFPTRGIKDPKAEDLIPEFRGYLSLGKSLKTGIERSRFETMVKF